MGQLRKILFPFSIVYDGVTSLRNKLFDIGVLKATKFKIPVIVVGNLSVGGTGKTPQIEYLIRLLKNTYKVAVLSRGYKRKTKGFMLAGESVSVAELGDEPFQFFSKFGGIEVAVDEDRVHGINQLLKIEKSLGVILLDDAYQHRKVQSDFNILLTTYNDLYMDDLLLPAGNLRESRRGANRAKIVVVTKCPSEVTISERQKIKAKLRLSKEQQLFFTTVRYADEIKSSIGSIPLSELKEYQLLVVTGIANPAPMLQFLNSKELSFEHIQFSDHHNFSENEISDLQIKFDKIATNKKIILTTEKDFMRLNSKLTCSFLEIQVAFLEKGKSFDSAIIDYVSKKVN